MESKPALATCMARGSSRRFRAPSSEPFWVVHMSEGCKEMDAQRVSQFVDEARKNQLRVVRREDLATYKAYRKELLALEEQFRRSPAPGPVDIRLTMQVKPNV